MEVDAATKEGMTQLDEEEEKFRERLEKEKEEWFKEVDRLRVDFEAVQLFGDYDEYQEFYIEVKKLEEGLQNAMNSLISYNKREVLFEQPLTDKSELNKMMENFTPFNNLWTYVHEFRENQSDWTVKQSIQELDAANIEKLTDQWYRGCFMLNKKLQDKSPEAIGVVKRLKGDLEKFQQQLPLIKALSNKALTENHWKQLTELAGLQDPLDQRTETVDTLSSKGLNNFIESIEELSNRAAREFKLKIKLQQMKDEVEHIVLEIVEHKDTYKIRTTEDIQNILDEQIVNIQAMKTSPYAKPIEDQCKSWELRLQNLQETLEEWIKFQRDWMKLEPIFGSEDIKKQMGQEARMFKKLDSEWRNIMDMAFKSNELLENIPADGQMLVMFREQNSVLEDIQRSLNQYLETKRLSFSRFFFLSDEDLVSILSQTKDPLKVRDHLSKCFEAIEDVVFTDALHIVTMISPEKERVDLIKRIDVNEGNNHGNVDLWMLELEKSMFKTVQQITLDSFSAYQTDKRTNWVTKWPGMVILCVNQIIWTAGVENALDNAKSGGVAKYEQELTGQLMEIVELVRGELPSLVRKTLGALVTIDVHARDIVTMLQQKNVTDKDNFDWLAQLRYYWNNKDIDCKMVNSSIKYGFEYLGNSPRLVITSLTDRCYRTLIGAYNLFYGGAPEGPAGTGKTESVKDLAKAVAVKCVVFNCSDNLDYKAMGKFFKGLASSGSWCCFDEFNRIEPEVLSVVATQLLQIQQAIRERKKVFLFEGTQLNLVHSCAVNITMNPGYAGRSDLPDNLKALFRPCAMMVPDYAMISEISLFAYGFKEARALATKIVASLRLSSEQLSTQSHYDFGMRAIKAILVACGNLKMRYKESQDENLLGLRALMDVNLPKFTSNDIPLFLGITNDLFPGYQRQDIDYGDLFTYLDYASQEDNLQFVKGFRDKCIQLYETILVRHGLMLVGQTMSGKSKVINTLGNAIRSIPDNPEFMKVHIRTLNPKSITQYYLYGRNNPESQEWTDGVLALLVREFAENKTNERKWVVFDGPVDAVWIENMNTVLDDNKMLCLSSGEIIKLSENMTMMFEVEDLKEASPATVSRCGMVYLEPIQLGWEVLVDSYVQTLPYFLIDQYAQQIKDFFKWILYPVEQFVVKNCKLPVPVTEFEFVATSLNLFDCFMQEFRDMLVLDLGDSPVKTEQGEVIYDVPKDLDEQIPNFILFSVIWGYGGSIDEHSRDKFCQFLDALLMGQNVVTEFNLIDVPQNWQPQTKQFKLPSTYFDCVYTKREKAYYWINWMNVLPNVYAVPKEMEFYEIMVPIKDTIRVNYLLNFLAKSQKHVLFSGPTGTGKTVSILSELNGSFNNEQYCYQFMSFSAQTSAENTQFILENSLQKRNRGTYAPPANKKMIIFVDDLNMPQKEKYGAQPPIELLRQWMDYQGWYDLETKEFRKSIDIQFCASMGPPDGGRNHVTQRYLRHYCKIYVEPYSDDSLYTIFSCIMDWFFNRSSTPFPRHITEKKDSLIYSTIEVFKRVSQELLPTPQKSHYLYNLRDVSKVFQGFSQTQPVAVKDEKSLIKLWIHECQRVFMDRLINTNDRAVFQKLIQEIMKKHYKRTWDDVVQVEPLLFGDFIPMVSEGEGRAPVPDVYCELHDHILLKEKMEDFMDYYNNTNKVKMNLVLFMAAIEIVVKIVRIIKQPFGNALLVGVGGSGRRSLTLLATSIAEYAVFEVVVSNNFGMNDWREQLLKVLMQAGLENKPTVFILSDTQISNEGFLEDINNLLNNGEVPNLLKVENKQAIQDGLRDLAYAQKRASSEEIIMAMFVERVRLNLHLSLCLSYIGENFRRRLRMFPSLVNCTTINWFLPWPKDALSSVAKHFLLDLDTDQETKQGIVDICVDMQERVNNLSIKYREELRRYYYVTPTSYLELLNAFKGLLGTKRVEVQRNINRYDTGLDKIKETKEAVSEMKEILTKMEPELIQSQKETKEKMEQLTVQQADAEVVQAQCEVEEAKCKEEAEAAEAIRKECQDKLDEAMPIWESAIAALDVIKRPDLVEMKALNNPPGGVVLTLQAVCIIMGKTPNMRNKASGFGKEPDWLDTAKKKLFTSANLIRDLKEFDKDNIDAEIIKKIEPMMNSSEFVPEKIAKTSNAAKGMCMWARAMYQYDGVMKIIRPKQADLAEANAKLKAAQDLLDEKKENLRQIQEHVAQLQAEYEASVQKEKQLQDKVDDCRIKLERAEKLIGGLKDEQIRWAETAQELKALFVNLTGDLIVSSGIIAYLGVFTGRYRADCIEEWAKQIRSKNIPCSQEFNLQLILGSPVQIREWTINHLPNDSFSIDNAIILKESKRWPLMIDPQTQAIKWIKKQEGENLGIVKLSNSDLINTLVNGINYGKPILIENIGEVLNPELDNLLSTKKGTEALVEIGDKNAEMTKEFMLYLATKIPRPHYSPEICVRVTLLNFMTTEEGLLDQMLATTIEIEAPKIEASRQKCIQDNAKFQSQLKGLEDHILELLGASQGDILDDEDLINALHDSKQTSKEIKEQLDKQESIQKHINETRRQYWPVAYRVSQLFFCVADMGSVEPMYQYSLEWYERIYRVAIQSAEKTNITSERVKNLRSQFTLLLYENTCRSLYVKDKLLFALLLTIRVMQSEGELDPKVLRFLMTGPVWTTTDLPNPTQTDNQSPWLDFKEWAGICELAQLSEAYQGFDQEFANNADGWKHVWMSAEPLEEVWPSNWKEKLDQFHRLLVLRILRPDKVVQAIQALIENELGKEFTSPPDFNLEISFKDSDVQVPLIFILSPGLDPISEIEKLAIKMNCKHRMKAISLGDGQGKIAEDAIDRAIGDGSWVILQNCHLARKFMPTLEKKVEDIDPVNTNGTFRLWLTSSPCDFFPVSILQNGIKITNEAPKGIKKNLIRSYLTYDHNSFEDCSKVNEWKRMLYGLTFFHALVQERCKFGALGWNIPYEFSMSDLVISVSQLKMFLNQYESIPWDALKYMVAQANYGGRVTDYWDRRTISTIITDFYTPDILQESYKFSESGNYVVPPEGILDDYLRYIEQYLPQYDQTEVFGLHENAAITSAINETMELLENCLSLLPRTIGDSSKTPDQILTEKANEIFEKMPPLFDLEEAGRKYKLEYSESMNTVLIQELIRFNVLLSVVRNSVVQLMKAISGQVIMSLELEEVGNAIFDNRVPDLWKKVSYPSLKPLGFWINDFLDRLNFMQNWIDNGAPNCYWISGFFFTQSFLTGTAQNYARKYQIPIDTITWDFEVQSTQMTPESITEPPTDGCYVHGLFLDGARWDDQGGFLNEQLPKVLFSKVPVIWLKPVKMQDFQKGHRYECPVYKTSQRAGTLSTTGHSTNFVLPILLPMQQQHTEKHWIKRGAALLTQLNS